tara:strand:+ start:2350 stop:3564 length:1215 start_codon:yes stop_codon:yes gene_type:complete
MNFENIVREWSYRVPNGTPNITSQSDKTILRDILREQNVGEPVITELVDNMSKVSLNEIAMKSLATKVKEIVTFLNSGKLFSVETVERILALARRDEQEFEETLASISGFGLSSGTAREVTEKIFSYSAAECKVIVEYLKNRSVGFSELKGATKLTSLFSSTGINGNFLNWLAKYEWAGSPSVGKGEALLAILCKGGGKPQGKKGDVYINNQEVEVKGNSGRLKGQKGYSDGQQASKLFGKGLKDLMSKLDEKDRPIKLDKIPGAGSGSYQLGPSNIKNNALNNHAPILIKKKVAKRSDIVKIYKEALSAVFHGMSLSWIDKQINAKGQISSINSFDKEFFLAVFDYYVKVEKMNHIIVLNPNSGAMGYIGKGMDPLSVVNIVSRPSFTSGAGSQGMTFAISAK